MISIRTSRRFLLILVLCLAVQHAVAQSPTFHQAITVGQDGRRSLQLTNDSNLPITAFLVMHFASLGLEGRDYYDVYIDTMDQVIPPGGSITRSLSAFKGAEDKVRAEVRAVIFKDGSSAGDPVWVNAVLARRLRLYDRTLSLHDLLSPLVGRGISREEIVEKLRASEAEAEKQLPGDDLRIMDALAFHGAISTIDNNRQAPVDVVLKRYLEYLEKRARLLEYSHPDMDMIRSLPVSVPKPLSEESPPIESREADAAPTTESVGSFVDPAPTLSSCTVDVPFSETSASQVQCQDTAGDTVTQTHYYEFSIDFTQYNATTKQTKTLPWSSHPSSAYFGAFGVCWAFIDCDAVNDVYWIQGQAFGQADAMTGFVPPIIYQGQTAHRFYWLLDDYQQPTLTNCSECDPYPNGQENPTSTNAPYSSTIWSVNYACAVTP